jgi:prepilin-type N-terminal cleavage/methylation domain-containing protein
MRHRRGFTFVEIMLVTAIFAALSAAIFTCLSNGIKLWDRGRQLMVQEDAVIFFDRFSSDLRNTFNYSKFYFVGGEQSLAFPTMVWTPADRVSVRAFEGLMDQMGRVRYMYDAEHGTIVRSQANYSQALREEWGADEIVVPLVKSVRFYYFYTASKDPSMSVDEGDDIPSGVEVELVIPSGKEDKVLKRYIALPAGV